MSEHGDHDSRRSEGKSTVLPQNDRSAARPQALTHSPLLPGRPIGKAWTRKTSRTGRQRSTQSLVTSTAVLALATLPRLSSLANVTVAPAEALPATSKLVTVLDPGTEAFWNHLYSG